MPGYISEVDVVGAGGGGSGYEFIEVAVPTGTDVSAYSIYVYNSDGSIAQSALSLGTLQSTTAGNDVYVVDNATSGLTDITWAQAIALVDDTGTVVQFISFSGGAVTGTAGPANGLTSTELGTHSSTGSLQSDDGGSSYTQQSESNAGTVPCYAPGTLIDTPDGPRAVETLHPGDLVMTRDHGPQMIRWTRSGDYPLEQADRDAKPVLIKAGALGLNLPARDLIVSPQHRMFVGGGGQLDWIFTTEVLAPAKALTTLPGIRHMMGKTRITWVHFACSRHEVVRANGCWSESLLLGPMVLQRLSETQRGALCELFRSGTGDAALNGPPARPCLKRGETRRMIAQASKSCQLAA